MAFSHTSRFCAVFTVLWRFVICVRATPLILATYKFLRTSAHKPTLIKSMTGGKGKQQSQRKSPGYMRLADLAQLLDITHAHLANLVRRGTLAHHQDRDCGARSHRSREKINGGGCALRTARTAQEGAAVTERNFVPTAPHQLTFTCHETADVAHISLDMVRKPAPDLNLLAASIPALRSSRQCGGARIINSPDLPSRRGICLGRRPWEQNQFERSRPNAG